MEILLAGYNIDADLIGEFKALNPDADNLTPETIAAAYARISRSPKSVTELRAIAKEEVEKARKSAKNIAFDMGHSSIAEHAVFNIDVIGVSRLLVEEIEKFRLCSYTEKSQRYVLFKDDFVIPEEIRAAGFEGPYCDLIRRQNKMYYHLYEKLRPHVFAKNPELAQNRTHQSTLEGWAKEDARYIISLATETQLGMTLNARNLELMLRRLAAHPLREARSFGRGLYEATKDAAPSLIRYTEATPYDLLTKQALKEAEEKIMPGVDRKRKATAKQVDLLYATGDADEMLVAALLQSSSLAAFAECRDAAAKMRAAQRKEFVKTVFRHMKSFDNPPREFETIDLVFELIVSASCFAQLKRHRMATIIAQDYDAALGVTVPPSIIEIGMQQPFLEIAAAANALHEKVRSASYTAAPYVLTNAHRRRVLFKINARELYHIARLRADAHAQWDIRGISEKMLALAGKRMPLALMMAVGKDDFTARYDEIFPS